MAIADYRGSTLGETYKNINALAADMQQNGYQVIEYRPNGVILDDGSMVTLKGEVSKASVK